MSLSIGYDLVKNFCTICVRVLTLIALLYLPINSATTVTTISGATRIQNILVYHVHVYVLQTVHAKRMYMYMYIVHMHVYIHISTTELE